LGDFLRFSLRQSAVVTGLSLAMLTAFGVVNATGNAAFAVSSWSSPATISIPGTDAFNPHITVDSTGLATAVWQSFNGSHNVVQASTSQNGSSWSPPATLSEAGQNASDQDVTVDSTGLATAVWTRSNGSRVVLQASTSDNGGLWSPPATLSEAGLDAFEPQITVDNTGLATAVWVRSDDGSDSVVQASTSQNGGLWSSPATLSGVGRNGNLPHITVDNTGLATAVWTAVVGINSVVQASTSDSGGTWAPPVTISEVGQDAFAPRITVDNTGLATAVWTRSDGSNNVVQGSTSQNGGTWSSPVTISTAGQNTDTPDLTVDATGRAAAVWIRSDGSNNVVQGSTSQNGGTWAPPATLSDTGLDANSPHITVDINGYATAVWAGFDGSNPVVQASTSRNGGPWSPVATLSDVGHDADSPRLTVDNKGLATAVWSRSDDSENFLVQASTLDNSVAPTPTLIPTAGPELAATGTTSTDATTRTLLTAGGASILLLGIIGTVQARRRTTKK
jgi:hypothetical protein